jgi:L-fucose isomerase-like protein
MSTPTLRLGLVPSYRNTGPIPEWVIQMRHETITALSTLEGVDLVYPHPPEENPADGSGCVTPGGCIFTLDQADALADQFLQQNVEGVIIAPLNFGDERSAVKVAERLKRPTLLYATKEPPVPEGPSLARVSDSYCGTLSIAAGLHRRGLAFQFGGLFSHNEPALTAAVATFARAAAVARAFTNARIGQVGVRPATFETVAFDELALAEKFGQNVIFAEVSDIVDKARGFSDDTARVRQTLAEIREEVAEISIAPDWLLKAAKLENAFVDFWQENSLSALSAQCWPTINRLWAMSVCAVFGRLTGNGMLTACEADTLGALSMLANYHASGGRRVPHFIDWTIQHREDPNQLLAWHCGNAPLCLARDRGQTALRSRRDMQGTQPAHPGDNFAGLYQFQVRSGPVTFCRLAENRGDWKMLIARGEAVPSDEVLAGTWSWVRVADHDRLYRTLVENGFIHHASMIHEDQTKVLELACKFLDIEPVIVE